jgi:hypothetical protein
MVQRRPGIDIAAPLSTLSRYEARKRSCETGIDSDPQGRPTLRRGHGGKLYRDIPHVTRPNDNADRSVKARMIGPKAATYARLAQECEQSGLRDGW